MKQSRYRGLRPFKKGQSGNPKGRPKKGLAIADLVCELLETPKSKRGIEPRVKIINKAIRQAVGGNKDARAWLFDRGYGKVSQPVETPPGQALRVIIEGGVNGEQTGTAPT